MGQKRWALSVPLVGFALAEHAEVAREAERLGMPKVDHLMTGKVRVNALTPYGR